MVGALSGQLASQGTGRTAPVQLDSFQLLLKKITMRGYSADDDLAARPEWDRRFAEWSQNGDIVFPHAVVTGIENAPQALLDAISGRHVGVIVVGLWYSGPEGAVAWLDARLPMPRGTAESMLIACRAHCVPPTPPASATTN